MKYFKIKKKLLIESIFRHHKFYCVYFNYNFFLYYTDCENADLGNEI